MSRTARGCFDRMVREAEAALAQLQPAFEAELDRAVNRLLEIWIASGTRPATEPTAALFRIAHDLKGQGKSFGFDLLTDVAASLCTLLNNPNSDNPWRSQAVDLHVRSLQLIARKRIRGDGGPLGRELLNEMAVLSTKAT